MTSPVSHSCKWWSCHMAQGTQQTPASSLLWREKQKTVGSQMPAALSGFQWYHVLQERGYKKRHS